MYSACSVACIAKYESRMRVESSLQQRMYCRISTGIYSMSRFVCIIFSSVSVFYGLRALGESWREKNSWYSVVCIGRMVQYL